MVVVPIVDSVWGTPTSCATDATARSPSVCIIRVKPVGANANGRAARLPRMSRLVSIVDTSCSTDGLELDPGERRPGAAERLLAVSGAVAVVEHRARRAPPGDQPQVRHGGGAAQPPCRRRPGRTGRAAAAGRARRAGAGDAGPSTQRKPIRPSVAGPDASATAPRCRARPRPLIAKRRLAVARMATRRRENGDSPSREWRLAVSGGGGPARRRPPRPRSPRPATPPRRAWGWPAARPGAVAPTPTGRSSRSPAPARPARAAPP